MVASTTPAKTSWATKDWVTVIFSTASLLLAVAAFYFSNVLVDERLAVNVADVSAVYDKNATAAESAMPNAFEITLVLFNVGNRPINLFGVWYHVAYKGDITNGGQGAACEDDRPQLPLGIPAKETRVVRLRIPQNHLSNLFGDGARIDGDRDGRRLTWQLQFTWFDSAGRHEQVSDFIGTMRVTFTGATHLDWPGVYSEKERARLYPPIVLRAPHDRERDKR